MMVWWMLSGVMCDVCCFILIGCVIIVCVLCVCM